MSRQFHSRFRFPFRFRFPIPIPTPFGRARNRKPEWESESESESGGALPRNMSRVTALHRSEVIMLQLGTIFFAVGIAPSFAAAAPSPSPPTVSRTHVEHRAVFDLVSHKTDLRSVCAGKEPIDVEYKRTAGDVAAAVFTGLWYTPVHVRVTCSDR